MLEPQLLFGPARVHVKLKGARYLNTSCHLLRKRGKFWMLRFMTHCPNPTGVGGLQFRRHDLFKFGVTAICGAKTRAGTPCRAAPVGSTRGKTKGLNSGRCVRHGGLSRGQGKHAPPEYNPRKARSKALVMLRKAAREALAGMTLHSDAMKIFDNYANGIYQPNAEMLILSCDQFARGEIDAIQLRLAVEMARKRY